jgi:phosphotransacetylase
MPTLDAANISFNLLKVTSGGGVTLGPILLGVARPVHILTPSATVRRIVNMTALTTSTPTCSSSRCFCSVDGGPAVLGRVGAR